MTDLFYKNHLFICVNKKKDGTGCGMYPVSGDIIQELKVRSRLMNESSSEKVRVSSAGCLGRCKEGPIAVLYPQGDWFHFDQQDEKTRLLQVFQTVLTCHLKN